jgi:pimeloyl-ACP methyl ester carboxylesterase
MYINANKKNIFAYTGARDHQSEQESVVFVHGTGMDHTVWVLPARFFARHQYNVLATDLPGHGRSEGPPPDTIEHMSDEVVAAMDAAKIEKAALVGHSMGSLGRLPLLLATRNAHARGHLSVPLDQGRSTSPF